VSSYHLRKPHILMVDNFDSFTYNLVDYLEQLDAQCTVVRNSVAIPATGYDGLLLSPGPGTPQKAGRLMEFLRHYENRIPILGICLGHQAIGCHFGAGLYRNAPMHGKISTVHTFAPDPMFEGVPDQLNVVRYHSLLLKNIPTVLKITAVTPKGEVMAVRHLKKPIWGIQYHPEAILTEYGMPVLQNWLKQCLAQKSAKKTVPS